jgi:hypothetical protein
MAYIHMYQGTVTKGGTDGTLVSENTNSAPIVTALNASNNEVSADIKLALRCDSGYQTYGNTTVTPTGTSASSWCLANDAGAGTAPSTYGGYGSALTITSVIGATNTIIWAKAKSVSSETPANDVSVKLQISATIEVP